MKKNNKYKKQMRRKKTTAEKKLAHTNCLNQEENLTPSIEEGEQGGKICVCHSMIPAWGTSEDEQLAKEVFFLSEVFDMFQSNKMVDNVIMKITFYGKDDGINDAIEKLKSFSSTLSPSFAISEKAVADGVFFGGFKKQSKREHIRLSNDELSIQMDETFDVGELFGLNLNQVEKVCFTLPKDCSEKLKKQTHLLRSCLLGMMYDNEFNISEISISCENQAVLIDMMEMEKKLPFPLLIELSKDYDGKIIATISKTFGLGAFKKVA